MITKENNIYKGVSDNVEFYFSTKYDGVSTGSYESLNLSFTVGDIASNVVKNRQIYAEKMNKDLNNFVYMGQTHSNNKYLVTNNDIGNGVYELGTINDTDCLYTFDKGIVLSAFFADCTPLFFYNKKANLVGIIHAGWQGTVIEIAYKVLSEVISEYNLNANDFEVVMGPSIFNMEAKEDIFKQVPAEYKICCTSTTFDVRLCNTMQINKAGITNITYMGLDTYTSEEFFSFRQENKSGRMNGSITQS